MAKTKLKRGRLVKKFAADSPPKVQKKIKKDKKEKKPRPANSEFESIDALLEPFSKEQLVTLVADLSLTHESLLSLVKSAADGDISHRKIFVYGLGWDATQENVQSVFGAYGEIEDLKVVSDRNTGKCKGYAFITYKTRISASMLLKNPKVQVGNRVTSCQLASEGRTAPSAGSVGIVSQQFFTADYPQRKIFVNNVPSTTSAEKLRAFFDKFGEIESGPKGLDPTTGRFRGYAIFVFKTVEGAKKVLEEPFKLFEGSQLHCQKAAEGKTKFADGVASITTVMQPLQPQMLAAVAAAQQVQNMALLGQQMGLVNPSYAGGMISNANLGALLGGYHGMIGGQMPGLAPYVAPNAGEGGSNGAMLQGLQYMYPSTQSGQTSQLRGRATGSLANNYTPNSWYDKLVLYYIMNIVCSSVFVFQFFHFALCLSWLRTMCVCVCLLIYTLDQCGITQQ